MLYVAVHAQQLILEDSHAHPQTPSEEAAEGAVPSEDICRETREGGRRQLLISLGHTVRNPEVGEPGRRGKACKGTPWVLKIYTTVTTVDGADQARSVGTWGVSRGQEYK